MSTISRFAAFAVLAAALTLPAAVRAEDHGTMESRGATTLKSTGGPLAPSLYGKPVVVRIHADWCPACHETQAALDEVTAKFGKRITYVVFDVTNGKTAAEARVTADSLGLVKFFDATKAATSTVAVIDPRTGNVLAEFYADPMASDYEHAIVRAQALNKK